MAEVVKRKADWSDLRVFWAVAELGSFGAVARNLGLGLTTVTRTVDRLEEQLAAKLFTRGPHGVTLTEAGTLAYDRALSMERVAEQLEREIVNSEKAPEGRVKISAPDGVAGIFLPPFMAEFVRANPKIDLAVDCDLWPDRPMAGDADLALTFQEPKHPDAVATPLAHFHYALFASREYLELYGVPTTPAEVLAHPYVHHVGQAHHPGELEAAAAGHSRPGHQAGGDQFQRRLLLGRAQRGGSGTHADGDPGAGSVAGDDRPVQLSDHSLVDGATPRHRPFGAGAAGDGVAEGHLQPEGQALVPRRIRASARVRPLSRPERRPAVAGGGRGAGSPPTSRPVGLTAF